MRILLNKEVFKGKTPFIKAISLEDDNVKLIDWVNWKIINTISIVRLILKCNEIDKINYKKRMKDSFDYNIIFDFNDKLKEKVLKQYQGIIEMMSLKGRASLINLLNEYENNWT